MLGNLWVIPRPQGCCKVTLGTPLQATLVNKATKYSYTCFCSHISYVHTTSPNASIRIGSSPPDPHDVIWLIKYESKNHCIFFATYLKHV
jgi:hypothetical protein